MILYIHIEIYPCSAPCTNGYEGFVVCNINIQAEPYNLHCGIMRFPHVQEHANMVLLLVPLHYSYYKRQTDTLWLYNATLAPYLWCVSSQPAPATASKEPLLIHSRAAWPGTSHSELVNRLATGTVRNMVQCRASAFGSEPCQLMPSDSSKERHGRWGGRTCWHAMSQTKQCSRCPVPSRWLLGP